MRVLVCGGRDFSDWPLLDKTLFEMLHVPKPHGTEANESWLPPKGLVIISGGALGADTMAIDWAVGNWVQFEEYKADWDAHGKAAGPIRNQRMIDEGKPDMVIAFPGGRGTTDMINRAKAAGIKVIQIGQSQQEELI